MNQRKRQGKSVISVGSSTGRDSGNCQDQWQVIITQEQEAQSGDSKFKQTMWKMMGQLLLLT